MSGRLARVAITVVAVWVYGAGAAAIEYEVFVAIQSEEDLYDLRNEGQIEDATFSALLLLFQTRVDLNRADRERLYAIPNLTYADVDRIIAYRNEVESVRELEDLAEASVLPRRTVESMRPFVLVDPMRHGDGNASGVGRVQVRMSGAQDRYPPASAAQARVLGPRNLDIGMLAVLERNRVRKVRYDPSREALSAEPPTAFFGVPKLYLQWKEERWSLIVGTYRIGFGQSLVFDTTDQLGPNGFFGDYELRRQNDLTLRCKEVRGELATSPCPEGHESRVTPDFTWSNRLTGVAVGLREDGWGRGWLQAYGWGSYQFHRAQQSEIVNVDRCSDPRRNEDPACASPPVYVRRQDGTPLSRFISTTLPAVYVEGVGGANISYFWDARAHIGLTGYGAATRWRVKGVRLDFQEFARKPFGGAFGAVGFNAGYGFGPQDLFVEVSRSIDSQPEGGGGWAALLRGVTDLGHTEVDVSLRYYGRRFANPYARPVSAPDEFEGLRARDEAGLRLRSTSRFNGRHGLRTRFDLWRELSARDVKANLFVRADLALAPGWSLALWSEYENKSLRRNGRGECFEGSLGRDEAGESIACGGQQIVTAIRLGLATPRTVSISAQYLHEWIDSNSYLDRFQQDVAAVVTMSATVADPIMIRVRARYDFEDIFDTARLEHKLWAYLEAVISLRKRDRLRLRYDVRVFLDRRASTAARRPNPEHWLWMEYLWRFGG